ENILKTQFLLQEKIDEFNSSKKQRSTVLQNQQMQLKVLEEDKKEKDENVKQLKEQEQEIASLIKKKEKERINLNRAIEVAIRRAREEAEKQARLARQKALEDEKRRREKAEKEAKENIARNNKPDAPVTAPTNKPSADVNKPLVSTTSERPYSDLEGTAKGLEQSINFEKNRGNLPWPISGKAVITGRFGKERYGDTKLFIQNDGLILSTDVGTAVKSVADGVVTSVFEIGEAYAVVVQHGKYFTIYNKLSSTSVSIGQSVVAGTLLGRVAANFDGVGEFEFRVTNERNVHLNPEGWLKRAR
ncbi:MAG: murein hydrolase activator EnvC family protein, partial [Chitinophagaceae bacterium]